MSDFREKLNSADFLRVVCVGDMQTSQPYSAPKWSDWLFRSLTESGDIQTSWRRQLINTAVDRATPKHVYTYFSNYIGQFKPDIVLLSFGISPFFPEYNEKAFSTELDTLLDTFARNSIQVALWSPYPLLGGTKRGETLSIGALYQQKALARGLQFIDLYHEFDELELSRVFTYDVKTPSELFGLEVGKLDFVSLNEIGNYVVARKIANDLFKLPLPNRDVGAYKIPGMETVKRWN